MAVILSAPVVIVCCLLLQLAGGKDLYWQPSSNWGSPRNWALGKVPACGDKASLASVPDNSVIYLDTDTTVRSISLPSNGRLIISPSVTIRLSSGDDCTVSGDTEPMAAAVENEFTGASVDYWECADNWGTRDGFPVEHAPCGSDRAFFDKGAFSFVKANDSIFVSSLSVRGEELQSLTSPEFDFQLQVNGECASSPVLCPCPDDSKCPKPLAPSVSGQSGGPNTGAIVGGVIFGILVVVTVVLVLVIIGAALYLRRRRSVSYMKEELIDEPESNVGENINQPFDNPVYAAADEVKVDLGSEMGKTPLEDVPGGTPATLTTYEDNPVLYPPDEKRAPKLNEYERL